MTRTRMIALSLLSPVALALAACGSGASGDASGAVADALPKVDAPAGQTWSAMVRATDDGFLMGNPDAPIKIVEYGSLTCSHCGEFSQTSHEELRRDYIDTGRVSFELRPYVRDPLDLALATVAVCAGPQRFFPLVDSIFAGQGPMLESAQAAAQSNQAALDNVQSLPEDQRMAATARIFGVPDLFAARGLSVDETNRCLNDSAAVQRRIEATSRSTQQYEITGTPTFLLNGTVMANVGTWDEMKQRLRDAGAR